MASFTNRSRYHVTVRNKPKLKREFPFSAADKARAYMDELEAQGYEPKLGQYEDSIEVRVRTKGHAEQHFTVTSYKDAELAANYIESERARGLFIDYTKSMNVTLAELIREYLIKESPKHKSCEVETYKLNALLVDSGAEPVMWVEQHPDGHPKLKERQTTGHQMRESITALEWLHKPFALIEPNDIEDFIRDRLQSVSPATVDRELDHLSSVINVAIKTWRYHVAMSPMAGVRRPKYFNERDRRLIGDEEERLLAAAREEDRLRSIEIRLEELMAEARAEAARLGSASSRKRAIAKARDEMLPIAETTFVHIPLYEALIEFLLKTAARRGEALALVWENVVVEQRYAFFPETKNGRPRKVPLRKELIEALESLPRTDDRVFPISSEQLRGAWERICSRARIEDLHIHDLRHEALSKIAETAGNFGNAAGVGFSLIDLQAISGHRDVRMLLRYAHLCVGQLAERLDAAFDASNVVAHKGRKRLGRGSAVSLADVVAAPASQRNLAYLNAAEPRAKEEALPDNVLPFVRKVS